MKSMASVKPIFVHEEWNTFTAVPANVNVTGLTRDGVRLHTILFSYVRIKCN